MMNVRDVSAKKLCDISPGTGLVYDSKPACFYSQSGSHNLQQRLARRETNLCTVAYTYYVPDEFNTHELDSRLFLPTAAARPISVQLKRKRVRIFTSSGAICSHKAELTPLDYFLDWRVTDVQREDHIVVACF